jgi:hypothetical protein
MVLCVDEKSQIQPFDRSQPCPQCVLAKLQSGDNKEVTPLNSMAVWFANSHRSLVVYSRRIGIRQHANGQIHHRFKKSSAKTCKPTNEKSRDLITSLRRKTVFTTCP